MKRRVVNSCWWRCVWLLFAILSIFGCVTEKQVRNNLPSPDGYVTDLSKILDDTDETILTVISQTLKADTGAELAVLTIDSMAPYKSIERYALDVANEWGVGEQHWNNGILIVVSIEDRQVRIEIGLGLESVFSDARTGEIMDIHLIPHFRNNEFGDGLIQTMNTIAEIIRSEYVR